MTNGLPQRFSAAPNPAHRGELVRCCYDFSGLPPGEIAVTIDFDPDPDKDITLDPDHRCHDFTVPDGCNGIVVVDNSGNSLAYSIGITL